MLLFMERYLSSSETEKFFRAFCALKLLWKCFFQLQATQLQQKCPKLSNIFSRSQLETFICSKLSTIQCLFFPLKLSGEDNISSFPSILFRSLRATTCTKVLAYSAAVWPSYLSRKLTLINISYSRKRNSSGWMSEIELYDSCMSMCPLNSSFIKNLNFQDWKQKSKRRTWLFNVILNF